MADMLYTGGVPGAQDHRAEQFRRPATIGGQPVDYSSGVARIAPTPEEARRAQETARRAAGAMLGWLGAESQNAVGTNYDVGALHAAQMLHAPSKMFSRETMLAVIAVERTKWLNDGTDTGAIRYRAAIETLDDLQHILERME